MSARLLFCLLLGMTAWKAVAAAPEDPVEVLIGPTPIVAGDALHDTDITVENGLFALSFAVGSHPPWGVAPGGILDLAVRGPDGELSEDLVSLIDFMPDNWSSWGTTYQDIEVTERTTEQASIRVERDWYDVTLTTVFTVRRGEATVHIHTEMHNQGDKPLEDLLSGYVLWADGGHLFTRPGLDELSAGQAHHALTDWTASYAGDWALAFHAPFADHVDYGGQDQYRQHTLNPGESISFEGWLQVIPDGELEPALVFASQRRDRPAATLQGRVTTRSGTAVADPIILFEQDGKLVSWATGSNGRYTATLPAGSWVVSARAQNHGGSEPMLVELEHGQSGELDFIDLREPGELTFKVSRSDDRSPLDARIRITEGPTSPVQYLGRSMLFTSLDQPGHLSLPMAPGEYSFEIEAAAGFLSLPVVRHARVEPGVVQTLEASMSMLFDPPGNSWYGADLHHHSDVLDGNSPPDSVLQAQLAAGLDLIFVSDHDSSIRHERMNELSRQRGIPFIPSMEISPSWGHFNAFPLELGAALSVDPSSAPVSDIFDDARRLGAGIISVNHPWIPYGYFHSLEQGTATGGFDPRFDLVELNAGSDTQRSFDLLYRLWDQGQAIYLAAGSDTHDVWAGGTGRIRMMAHVPGDVSVEGYVRALKNGHAYATEGPLIEPRPLFGSRLRTFPGEPLPLHFRVMSVHGLQEITLVENGIAIENRPLDRDQTDSAERFEVQPAQNSWYAVIVIDREGKRAFSNPIWVDTMSSLENPNLKKGTQKGDRFIFPKINLSPF